MNLDGLCFWHFFPGMFHDFGDSLKCFLGVRDDSWTSSGHFFFAELARDFHHPGDLGNLKMFTIKKHGTLWI
jgi:hypothetical protein